MTPPAEVAHGVGAIAYRGLELVDGTGATVETADGRRLLDAGGASYGTANVGHANPRVLDALDSQEGDLLHVSQAFAHPDRSGLVDELLEMAGPWAQRAFLSNSGTEAIEAAIKLALAHTGRPRLVAFEGGFHGRTLGALSATHRQEYRAPFQARLGDTTFVPYGDLDALEAALGPDVAAVLVEPVQGEGGVRVPPQGFLEAATEATREAGALLVADEVQTGLGRTGHPLAVHGSDVEPDLVCLAKSLAAGLPLGATVAHERVDALESGQHGSTFGGSPRACRAARAVLEALEADELPARARDVGRRLVDELRAIDDPLVREVRGRGLMVAVDVGARTTPVLKALQAEDVLALPAGPGTVRFLPPLVLGDDQATRIAEALAAALETVRASYAREASP